jgi:DNA polymerase V
MVVMKISPICLLHSRAESPAAVLKMLHSRLACGFPSPSDDYLESVPSLDNLLIKHPSATYLAKAEGDSMIERGILNGSLVIIDRSVEVFHEATIVASVAGDLTIKIIDLKNRLLRPANASYASIDLPEDIDVICEGVVTYCINPQHNYAFTC